MIDSKKEIERLLHISPDFLETDNEKSVYFQYANVSFNTLTEHDKSIIFKVLTPVLNRQLRYAQSKFYASFIEVLNVYDMLPHRIETLNIAVATITLESRLTLGSGEHSPNRSKGYNSFINNISKEFKKKLIELPDNPSKKDIDEAVKKATLDISKDLYGATTVFHVNNDISEYCENSDDPMIHSLYNLYRDIENYLIQSEKYSHLPPEQKQKNYTIDVSDTFIDGNKADNEKINLYPIDIKNINTLEDYYNQLVSLLTLLTNASMFEINPATGKKTTHRIVSEIDYTPCELIHLIELSDNPPANNLEYIEKLIEYAQKFYFTEHIPFDIQLKKAISERSKASKKTNYNAPLTKKQKEILQIKLEHLRKNLDRLKVDRLTTYYLNKEMGNIIKKLNDLPSFKIDILSSKISAKKNGFVSIYHILRINDIALFELQSQNEFRHIYSKEGNCAHNSSLPMKNFDILHFFELVNPTQNDKTNQELLRKFCTFLNSISYNSIKIEKARVASDQIYLDKLIELSNFCQSRIKIKKKFDESIIGNSEKSGASSNGNNLHKEITFNAYIDYIQKYYCALFGDIQANHSEGDHNTILIKNKTQKDALLSFFKNRIGVSALAYMIIEKYTLSKKNSKSEKYSTISSYIEASAAIRASTKKAYKKPKGYCEMPTDTPFYPMGKHPSDDVER